jgi:transposase
VHIATAKKMKADGHTGRDIAKYLGVSRATPKTNVVNLFG